MKRPYSGKYVANPIAHSSTEEWLYFQLRTTQSALRFAATIYNRLRYTVAGMISALDIVWNVRHTTGRQDLGVINYHGPCSPRHRGNSIKVSRHWI